MNALAETILQIPKGLRDQFRSNARTLLLFYPPLLAILAGVVVVRFSTEIDVRDLMRDSNSVLDAPFYIGLVSNVGILSWTPGVSIGFFAWAMLGRSRREGREEWRFFFLALSCLGGFLVLDDMFQFHEEIWKSYLFDNGPFGTGDGLILAGYAVGASFFVFRAWRTVAKTEYSLLFVSFGLLATSQAFDVGILNRWLIPDTGLRAVAEDGAKMLGIATWSLYMAREASRRLTDAFGAADQTNGATQ